MELMEFGTSFHSMEMEDTELWVELGSTDLEAEEQSLSLVSDASTSLLDELITSSLPSSPSSTSNDQPSSPTLYNNYLLYDNDDNAALKELDLGIELELDWDWCGSSDSDYLLSNNDDPEPSMILSDEVTELNFHTTQDQFNTITQAAVAEEDLQLQFNSILSSIPIPTLTTTESTQNVNITVSDSSIVPESVEVESPAIAEVSNPGPSGSRASGSKSKNTGTGRNTSKKAGGRGQAKKKGLDKVQRKKEQNKTAATRYREKKKIQAALVLNAEAELDAANNELRTKKENLLREINIIKSCVRELIRANKTKVGRK